MSGEVRLTPDELRSLRATRLYERQFKDVVPVVEAILAARLAPVEALAEEWDADWTASTSIKSPPWYSRDLRAALVRPEAGA